MSGDIPILEHDTARSAIIEPSKLYPRDPRLPRRVVLCFFNEVLQALFGEGRGQIIKHMTSEIGPNPVYHLEHEGGDVGVVHPGVGAPLCGALLEELIAMGAEQFIACGGAGVLDGAIGVGQVVIPTSAVRDEGTSYHYLPPSREVKPSERAVTAIETVLMRHRIPYRKGKTWTSDAIYRETPHKVARRRAEGCLTVEMEAAAFFAIAQFRKVTFGQLLYGGDDVSGADWDSRGWMGQRPTREKLFWLAVEAALAL